MVGKYSLDDIVKYQGKIYVIVECHAINWFSQTEPVVYGIILANKRPSNDRGERLYVRESLLSSLTEKEQLAWRLLYGKP